MKTILFWNEAYGSKNYGVCCGNEPFQECKVKNCYFTDDKNYLDSVDKYDLIQFHQRSTYSNDLPKKRSPDQIYMMWMFESAAYPFGFDSRKYNGFFNWTYTYLSGSTFHRPYEEMENHKPLPEEVMDDGQVSDLKLERYLKSFGKANAHRFKGRNKTVAWFVSNCEARSGRQNYVKKLKKYIDVSIKYSILCPTDCKLLLTTRHC